MLGSFNPMSSAGKCLQDYEWEENQARPRHTEAFKINVWIFYDLFKLNFELPPLKLLKQMTTLYIIQLDSNTPIWLLILSNCSLLYSTPISFGTPLCPWGFAGPFTLHHNHSKSKHRYLPTQRTIKSDEYQSHQMMALRHLKYELGEI